ncbi:MAG: MFS transporter [Acidobacteria bacterium]|nr:MFS transporter [Acidobacteriota bacterium]
MERANDNDAKRRGWLNRYNLGKPFWIFLCTSCLFNFGMFIFVLLYNLYLLDLGYKEDFLGWVSSAATAGNLLGAFAVVALTRRIGLKTSVVGFFATIAVVTALRALVVGQVALLGFAFLAGTLFAVWAVSFAVVIAQLTTVEQRPIAFSIYLATVIGVGVVADPIGGRLPGLLSAWFGAASAAQAKQWALLTACALLSLAVFPASRLRLAQSANDERVQYPRSSFVLRFMIAVAAMSIATAAFNPFANAFFSQYLRMPAHDIGLVFSGGQFAQVIAILLSPLILRRLGLVWGVAVMELAAGLSLSLLATGPPATMAALGFAGYMAFQWMDEPAMESLLMTRVQPHERSGAAAMMYMVIFAAGAVSSPLAGRGITRFGYPAVMWAAALLLLLGGMLFGILLKNVEPQGKPKDALMRDDASNADNRSAFHGKCPSDNWEVRDGCEG